MKPLLCAGQVVRNFLNVAPGSWPAKPIDPSKPWQWQDRRLGKIQSSEYTGLGVEYFKHATKGWQAVATYDAFPGRGTARWGICTSPYTLGDVLYVRETFHKSLAGLIRFAADVPVPMMESFRWSPSIHMPKELSRINLEVMRVRVERVCEISEEDAMAEGVRPRKITETYRTVFRHLWTDLYGLDAWEKYCWVYDLKRIK